MTVELPDLAGTFLYGLSRLDIDDTGLTDRNDMADLNAVAALCLALKQTPSTDTLYQLLLSRLVYCTEELLITHVIPDKRVVHDWLIARAELLAANTPTA
jgi:hypothetical protein